MTRARFKRHPFGNKSGLETASGLMRNRRTSLAHLAICALAAVFLGCQTAPIPSQWSGWEGAEVIPQEEPRLAPERRPAPPDGLPVAAPSIPAAEELAAIIPSPPQAVVPRQNRYREVQVKGPVIALTFDDGPSPRYTPALLDILKERQVRVTFFVVGQRAAAHPAILRRMAAEGHEIANHTWNHPVLTELSIDALRWQVSRTGEVVEAAVGYAPTLVRPPYGATSPGINRWLAEELGLTVVLWSVDSLDWKHRNADRVRHEILTHIRPGAIVLAHDIHATTVAAMPATLDRLKAAGYQFVTVSELIDLQDVR